MQKLIISFILLFTSTLTFLVGVEFIPFPAQDEDEPFVHSFDLTNPHQRAVRIGQTDASCSCEKFEIADEFLLPGESTTVSIIVDNENRSGLVQRRLWFYFTDPEFEPLEFNAEWEIRGLVTVDSVPAAQRDFTKRPQNRSYHDVYQYLTHVRPDEKRQLRKLILIGCHEKLIPEAGELKIERIDYKGELWAFETRRISPHQVLLIGRAKAELETLPIGTFSEKVTLHMNQPRKPKVELEFLSKIDEAGSSGTGAFPQLR